MIIYTEAVLPFPPPRTEHREVDIKQVLSNYYQEKPKHDKLCFGCAWLKLISAIKTVSRNLFGTSRAQGAQ